MGCGRGEVGSSEGGRVSERCCRCCCCCVCAMFSSVDDTTPDALTIMKDNRKLSEVCCFPLCSLFTVHCFGKRTSIFFRPSLFFCLLTLCFADDHTPDALTINGNVYKLKDNWIYLKNTNNNNKNSQTPFYYLIEAYIDV